MAKFLCQTCGFQYDEEAETLIMDTGLPPKTPFSEFPDTWTCPMCGSTKDGFEDTEGIGLCNRWK